MNQKIPLSKRIERSLPPLAVEIIMDLLVPIRKTAFRVIKRRQLHGGTSRARQRRLREKFFETWCRGRGLDIGYGGDPVVAGAQGWDIEHGNAQYLHGLDRESFDFVYSSHTLEHLPNPGVALRNWWAVLKKGGYLILYVPHRDLFEKRRHLPSVNNPKHTYFFLLDHDDPPDTIGLTSFIRRLLPDSRIVKAGVYGDGASNADRVTPSPGEDSIEVVVHKESGSGAPAGTDVDGKASDTA
jgi:SAM-dependent methyltransferase